MLNKILIVNRSEVAVRVIQTCHEMGIQTVAIYSETGRDCLYAMLANKAVCIGPTAPIDSYLNIEGILAAAVAMKTNAIHPGLGFLSESTRFVKLYAECSIAFIGLSAGIISKVGNRSEARRAMVETGVPVAPGSKKLVHTVEDGLTITKEIGFPVMIKASSGDDDKGMGISKDPEDFTELFDATQIESVKRFSNGTMYIEKYIERPKHVESQIIADRHDNVVRLGERDCSIQRRHQKMLEEVPRNVISPGLQKTMSDTTVKVAKAVGHENAETIGFLLDKDKNSCFMEMSTGIQVEHLVTEMVARVDLTEEQIRVVTGETLSVSQEDVRIEGHTTERRINTGSLSKNFILCLGRITNVHIPGDNGVRVDTHVYSDYKMSANCNPMLMKLTVYDRDQEAAISKIRNAPGEVVAEGVETNINSQYKILENDTSQQGGTDTSFAGKHFPDYVR